MSNQSPFDVSAMMKMFAPDQIAKMFDPKQMSAGFDTSKFQNFDLEKMMKSNQRNYDAMVAANTAAADAYKSFYETQMSVYKDVMSGASKHAEALQAKSVPDLQKKQSEIYNEAVAKSLSIMTDLAAATRKANEDAFAVIKTRVDEAISEINKK